MFYNLVKNTSEQTIKLKIKRVENLGAIRLTGINSEDELDYVILPKYFKVDLSSKGFFLYIKKGNTVFISVSNFSRDDNIRRALRKKSFNCKNLKLI